MNKLEQDVYRKYRHLLHKQPQSIYAPERRQNARAAVVNQFNIPYADVKRIIALGDAAAGITHEKPVDKRRPHILNVVERRETPIADLRVGDRIRTIFIDARILRIDEENLYVRGIFGEHMASRDFTLPLERAGESLPIVVEDNRKVQR